MNPNFPSIQPARNKPTEKAQGEEQKYADLKTKQDELFEKYIFQLDFRIVNIEKNLQECVTTTKVPQIIDEYVEKNESLRKAWKKEYFEEQLNQESVVTAHLQILLTQLDIYKPNPAEQKQSPINQKIQTLLDIGDKILYNLDISKHLKGNETQSMDSQKLQQTEDINKPQQIQSTQNLNEGFLEEQKNRISDLKQQLLKSEETIKSQSNSIEIIQQKLNEYGLSIQLIKNQTTDNQKLESLQDNSRVFQEKIDKLYFLYNINSKADCKSDNFSLKKSFQEVTDKLYQFLNIISKAQLDNLEQNIKTTLKKEMDNFKAELMKSNLQLQSTFQVEIDQLKEKLKSNDLEQSLKASCQSEIDNLKIQLNQVKQFIESSKDLQEQIETLKTQLLPDQDQKHQFPDKQIAFQEEIEKLKSMLSQFMTKQREINQNIEGRISKIETKELTEIADAFNLIITRLNNLENKENIEDLNQIYDQLQEGLVALETTKNEMNQKYFIYRFRFSEQINDQQKQFTKIKEELEKLINDLNQSQEEQKKKLLRLTQNVNQIQQEINVFQSNIMQLPPEQDEEANIMQTQVIIQQQQQYYEQIHPDLERLKVVQEKINQLYNLSCRRRSAIGQYQLFIKGKQNLQELFRNYGIRQSEQKSKLAKICNYFRQARGDGNCFYTSYGFQFITILLNVYNDNQFKQFLTKMDSFITFQINHGQQYQISTNELQKQCWEEFKYRLNFLKNMKGEKFRLEELVQNFAAYEQSTDYPLIDGCFYALSTIFFRNLAYHVIDHSEMKEQVFDQQNLLSWEIECNNNEIVIQELSKFLEVHTKLLFFENGKFQLREYNEGMPNQIILLIQPGHYNLGFLEQQEGQQ